MAGFRIEGDLSGNVAEVTAEKAMRVAYGNDSTLGGIAAVALRSDAGAITGDILDFDPECDQDSRARVALDRLEFIEPWTGAVLNSSSWQSVVATMATAVLDGSVRLNSANSAAINTSARITSYRTYPLNTPGILTADFPIQIAAASVGIVNTAWDVGFFIATGSALPTDGVFLRMSAASELRLVVSFGGVEAQSPPIAYTSTPPGFPGELLPVNETRAVTLTLDSRSARVWVNGALAAAVTTPPGQPSLCRSYALPFTARVFNSAVAPVSATQLRIGALSITTGGAGANVLSAAETAALSGQGGYQGYSGATLGTLANYANSAAPAAAALSNTAAGYTTLGGQFLFAAPAGAETDYALFGFQVPVQAAGSHNLNLLIHGARIDAVNIGATVAGTPTVLQWGLAVGSTAVSLATVEAATTRAPRRIPLGVQSWVVGALAGAPAEAIESSFRGGLLAEPGTFVHVIAKVPVGTATASQQIRGTVYIDASWV
jgi:hypothetical protein